MFETDGSRTEASTENCARRLAFWFGGAFLAICTLHVVGIYTMLPSSIRLPLCGFVFCMGPGFALFSALSLLRQSDYPYLTLLVLSCSLGLTYNFIANVAIYAWRPSLVQAMQVYLSVGCLLYVGVGVSWLRQGIVPWARWPRIRWSAVLGVGTALLVWSVVISNKTPPGLYVEELVILRKLFENSSISMSNIAFHADEYTTYFFVPFYQMLAMSAQFSGVDVLEVQQGLWPFTAAVSLLCLAAIAFQITGRWAAVAVIVTLGSLHGLFIPQPMSNALTVFAPFPDRYAFAAGVLVPLALFHFFIHMADRKMNIPAFVGLVYLIVEMTFIHARETLFFVGIVLVAACVMLLDYRERRHDLVRVMWLLVVVGLVLMAYRQINLTLQPDLGRFLSHLREDMIVQLQRGLDEHGVSSLLGIPQLHLDQYDTFPYEHHFAYWGFTPGLVFIPAVVWILPFYVLLVDRLALLVLPLAIAAFGLFSLFQGLHLIVGIIVGVPFIFDIFSVLFILIVVVFADLLTLVGAFVVSPKGGRLRRFGVWGIALVGGAVAMPLMMSRNTPTGFAAGNAVLEMVLYGVTVGCIVVRAAQLKRGIGAEVAHSGVAAQAPLLERLKLGRSLRVPSRKALAALLMARPHALIWAAVCLAGGVMLPALWFSSWPNRGEGTREVSRVATGTSDVLSRLYNGLDQQHLFHVAPDLSWRLPPEIVSYVRQEIPELQTWFGGHTMPVLMISNQYAPILSVSGALNPGFFANVPFVEQLQGAEAAKQFRLSSSTVQLGDVSRLLETGPDPRRSFDLLRRYGVQWVITRPSEGETMDRLVAANADVRRLLALHIESEGYRIYHVGDVDGVVRRSDE